MHRIDIKIYEEMSTSEFPFVSPLQLQRTKCHKNDVGVLEDKTILSTGYHQLYIDMTAEELSDFYNWAHQHGALIKILGSQDLGHVDLE